MTELASCICPAQTPRVACNGCQRCSPFATVPPELELTNFRMNHLNASGRGLTDQIVILDTRGTGSLASRIRRLAPHNFSGVQGDGTLNLHGLDIWEDSKQKLHILLINHRPPFDPTTGQALDATKVGANSTIELFEAAADGSIMHHVRTYHDNAIQTPNDVAWIGEDAFVFTNDHSWKVGLVSMTFANNLVYKLKIFSVED
jgi:arylesterase/paraoxonase